MSLRTFTTTAASKTTTWVAFFKGIDMRVRDYQVRVVKRGQSPMPELRAQLATLGCLDARQYMQVNLVFESDNMSRAQVTEQLHTLLDTGAYGYLRPFLVLEATEVQRVLRHNPYVKESKKDATKMYFYFMEEKPRKPDLSKIDYIQSMRRRERFGYKIETATDPPVVYIWMPDGLAFSQLAGKMDRLLGVTSICRNLEILQRVWQLVTNEKISRRQELGVAKRKNPRK